MSAGGRPAVSALAVIPAGERDRPPEAYRHRLPESARITGSKIASDRRLPMAFLLVR